MITFDASNRGFCVVTASAPTRRCTARPAQQLVFMEAAAGRKAYDRTRRRSTNSSRSLSLRSSAPTAGRSRSAQATPRTPGDAGGKSTSISMKSHQELSAREVNQCSPTLSANSAIIFTAIRKSSQNKIAKLPSEPRPARCISMNNYDRRGFTDQIETPIQVSRSRFFEPRRTRRPESISSLRFLLAALGSQLFHTVLNCSGSATLRAFVIHRLGQPTPTFRDFLRAPIQIEDETDQLFSLFDWQGSNGGFYGVETHAGQ